MREIADLLEKEGGEDGINMFKFILDPSSFSTTVENLFYLSFLVRDGLVSLEDNEEGEPIISELPTCDCMRSSCKCSPSFLLCAPLIACVEAPTEDDYNQGVARRQLVLELDMEIWEVSQAELQHVHRFITDTPHLCRSSSRPMRSRRPSFHLASLLLLCARVHGTDKRVCRARRDQVKAASYLCGSHVTQAYQSLFALPHVHVVPLHLPLSPNRLQSCNL